LKGQLDKSGFEAGGSESAGASAGNFQQCKIRHNLLFDIGGRPRSIMGAINPIFDTQVRTAYSQAGARGQYQLTVKAQTSPPLPPQPSLTEPDILEPESDAEQLVNTVNAARSGNFGRRELNYLPLPGWRSFDELAFLFPGVVPSPEAPGATSRVGLGPNLDSSGQYSVNGLRSRSN
jgi:hypothetical protein